MLIKVEAAPINPSDLALLISFASDPSTLSVSGSGNDTVASMDIHKGLMKAMTPRLDQSMQVGNEGAGIVEAAGANAEHLIGKTVGVAGGAMYSEYRCVPAMNCLVMEDGTSSRDAASSFVNPLITQEIFCSISTISSSLLFLSFFPFSVIITFRSFLLFLSIRNKNKT